MTRVLAALLASALVVTACSRDGDGDVAAADEPLSEPVVEEPDPEPDPEPEPEDTRPRSPLTGEQVDEDVLERALLIAKIENSPRSRPQTGLDAADVVYEEVVEGGVTRFFVLFHSQLPERAGPIRSARPVDTQLMAGYGRSGFAFSGARDEVQAMLARTPSVLITEGGAGFERDRGRSAPHNLYIRPPDTWQAIVDRGAEPLADVDWRFDADAPAGALSCSDAEGDVAGCEDPGAAVTITMSPSYRTTWEYDEEAGLYRRLQDGQRFFVTGEGVIGAANVVALAARHYIGASGYPETDVLTDGADAVVLRDGQRFAARWSKPTASDPVRLLTPDGAPFPLKPGPTWLHLPPRLPSLAN